MVAALLALCALLVCAVPALGAPQKIILDTDIGDDIDDAFALTLLCSAPDVRLLGVTTVHGETAKRAQIAAKLLDRLGRRDVPVFAGRPGTAKIGRQHEWARDFQSRAIRSEAAVEFLRREIARAPGEVTLVSIGALTNLGDLLTRFPETAPRIRRIVMMGGAAYVGYNNQAPPVVEWNIRCDPPAARAVFASGVPIVMAGLDVTTMMQLDAERQKRIFAYGTPATDALAALTALWGGGTPTLYDPVAVAYATGSAFSDSEPGHIEVADDGLTRLGPGAPNATVLVKPRKDAFLDWYVSALAPRVAEPARADRP